MRGILVVTLAALVASGCERHEDPGKVKSVIEDNARKLAEALDKEDVDGIMDLYWDSPNFIAMYPETTYIGAGATRAYWEKTFERIDVKKFDEKRRTIEVGHHMAYQWGVWSFTFQPEGSPEITLDGRSLLVWEEKEDKWVVVAVHASVPLAPPAPDASKKAAKSK
jgi:ketosteroid isomerase-like protein